VSGIGVKDERAFWFGQICRFFVSQRASNQGRRHVRHLITINKSESMLRFDSDSVKQIELRDLQDMLNRAELGTC